MHLLGELPNRVDSQVTVYDELSLASYDKLDYAHATSSHVSPSSAADTLNSAIENVPGSSSNAKSLSAVETSFSGLESSTREPPPAPVVYDRPRMTQPEYVNTRPDDEATSATETSYCGLDSSTREPPPASVVYDRPRMTQPEYVNTRPDDEASSATETSCCGLESSTHEPPPAPAVYDTMTKHEYVNTMRNGTAPEVICGTTSEEPHSNPEISSSVSLVVASRFLEYPVNLCTRLFLKPSYLILLYWVSKWFTKFHKKTGCRHYVSSSSASYFQLESSTRETPPAPAVYDTMTKHKYVNIMPNGAVSEVPEVICS